MCGKQVEGLEHHPELLAQLVEVASRHAGATFEGDVADGDDPLVRGFDEVDATQEGALARSARSDDREHVARRNRQADVVENGCAARSS